MMEPIVIRRDDGYLILDYPEGRPAFFSISSDLYDSLIQQLNELRGFGDDDR